MIKDTQIVPLSAMTRLMDRALLCTPDRFADNLMMFMFILAASLTRALLVVSSLNYMRML